MSSAPPLPSITPQQKDVIRLLVIPLLVFCAWLIEVYLLEGSRSLLAAPAPLPLLLYTLVGCIATGILVPVLLMPRAFASGTVTLEQIGFRHLRRTIASCTLVVALLLTGTLLLLPAGTDRAVAILLFLIHLPTGIAAAMVVWGFFGTHLQALVRSGGAPVSISAGVVLTSILFALFSRAATPVPVGPGPLAGPIIVGIITALFFFAVRDIYAAALLITGGIVAFSSGRTDPALLAGADWAIFLSAAATLGALIVVHIRFTQQYRTVMVIAGR
jgi:hypothetical protein